MYKEFESGFQYLYLELQHQQSDSTNRDDWLAALSMEPQYCSQYQMSGQSHNLVILFSEQIVPDLNTKIDVFYRLYHVKLQCYCTAACV